MLLGFAMLGLGIFLSFSTLSGLKRNNYGLHPDSEYICTLSDVVYIVSGKYTDKPTYTPLIGNDGKPVSCSEFRFRAKIEVLDIEGKN